MEKENLNSFCPTASPINEESEALVAEAVNCIFKL